MLQSTLDNKAPKATAEETTQGNSRIVQLLGFCNMKIYSPKILEV